MPFIDTRHVGRKPGCADERQGICFGQNGAWGLRESEILALYLKTDVPALETRFRAFLLGSYIIVS